MNHKFGEEVKRHESGDANLTEYVPVCSCGWRGFGIASYNDDLNHRMRKQADRHLREAAQQLPQNRSGT